MAIKLSVNVNKIATLRNARGGTQPGVVEFARAAVRAGAHGITVHPRPDERHIRRQDVRDLLPVVEGVEFNIEGFPDERYLSIVREARPHQATLVPDPPDALTSNEGWDCRTNKAFLQEVVAELKSYGARVSIFLEPDPEMAPHAAETGTDRIELYTEHFARAFERGEGEAAFERYDRTARVAVEAGLGINAGHDLSLENLVLMRRLTGLAEVSIGHALVVDALWRGWERTVRDYLDVLAPQAESTTR